MKHPNTLSVLRRERKMPQETLCFNLRRRGICLSLRTLSRYENGTHIPGLDMARHIADELELDPEDIWEDA